MVDLKLEVPQAEEVVVEPQTLAAIARGIEAAKNGKSVSLEELEEMIPKWITKFESQNPDA